MKSTTKSYIRGVALLSGMIIGVGLFGVPYVITKAGALFGIGYFVLLGAIMICTHLIYGEILLRTGNHHRLAGLARMYLGKFWGRVALVVSTLGFYSVMIAYIIMGGTFLWILLSPILGGALFTYQFAFFAAMSLLVFVGLRILVSSEIVMTAILLLCLGAIVLLGLPKINFINYTTLHPANFFLPYGVILFAIGGAAAVPEVLEVMSRNRKNAKSAILWGSLIPIVLMAIFSLVIVGVTGASTTKDAIEGLKGVMGGWFIYLGALFGLFGIATSFLPLAQYFKEQFILDFELNRHLAWILACIVPFVIFFLGMRDFIKIISFSGAVFSGLEGFLIAWIYQRAKSAGRREPEYKVNLPIVILGLIMIVFLLGMAYEMWSFFGALPA